MFTGYDSQSVTIDKSTPTTTFSSPPRLPTRRHGGNMGFGFFNKTNENIYLNLDECFFVRNDIANDYFLEREFTPTYRVLSIWWVEIFSNEIN
ncbi:MAG: hypothetical protein PHQ24_09620 [Proteiniphilum sp.]|nr:hypothetical protein [Proteiniphilum sp.]